MIDVGLDGVGPLWSRYRPALSRLRHPIQIAALYDVIFARADRALQSDSETSHSPFSPEAVVATGLQGLAKRGDLRAVLLMDCGWHGISALKPLSRHDKPLFVAPWLSATRETYQQIYESAEHNGCTIMPAMLRRFTPATIRLQELIATDLGRPHNIEIELPIDELCDLTLAESLVGWLDYCRNVFRSFAETAELKTISQDAASEEPAGASLTLHWAVGINASTTVKLISNRTADEVRERLQRISKGSETPHTAFVPDLDAALPRVKIDCESGTATLTSRTGISWCHASNVSQTDETLTSDRTEAEIMLDLFCRRVVGGLIPVADFRDITEALRLIELAGG